MFKFKSRGERKKVKIYLNNLLVFSDLHDIKILVSKTAKLEVIRLNELIGLYKF